MSLSYHETSMISGAYSAARECKANTEGLKKLMREQLELSQKIYAELSRSRLTGPDQDVFQKSIPA